jgi:glycosyltransferase involved in cell wall biosynthesis
MEGEVVTPRISVVLPVYNGAGQLAETIESIRGQSLDDFELVVVDDGSTDETPSILAGYADRDARLRVIRRANGGLTRALIEGCAAVRAPLIARQDCGDVSRPERWRRLVEIFAARPQCVVAAGECEFVGPGGETLYTTSHAEKNVRDALLHAGIEDIVSLPAGAAAVMRTDAYRRAGGYRAEFYFAQDVDLLIRLAAQGEVCVDPAVLYEVRVDVGSISSAYRAEQVSSAALAIAVRDAPDERRRAALLAEAARIRPRPRARSARAEADAHYFIASCLRQRRDGRWRSYARRAVRRAPLHLRSWLLLLRGLGG